MASGLSNAFVLALFVTLAQGIFGESHVSTLPWMTCYCFAAFCYSPSTERWLRLDQFSPAMGVKIWRVYHQNLKIQFLSMIWTICSPLCCHDTVINSMRRLWSVWLICLWRTEACPWWSCLIVVSLQGAPIVNLTETAVTSTIPSRPVGEASAAATATTDTAAPILFGGWLRMNKMIGTPF